MSSYEVTLVCQGKLMEKRIYKHFWMEMPWYIKSVLKVKRHGTMRVDVMGWRA